MKEHIKQFEKLLEIYPYDHANANVKEALNVSDEMVRKTVEFINNKIIDFDGGTVSSDVQNLEILVRRMVLDENPGPLRVICKVFVDSIYAEYEKKRVMHHLKDMIFRDEEEDDDDDRNEVTLNM